MTIADKSLSELAQSIPFRIIIRTLQDGPKRSSQIKLAYYGEARNSNKTAKGNKSSRSYDVKRIAAIEAGIMQQMVGAPEGTYEISSKGLELLMYCNENSISLDVKSEAQLSWEAKA